MLPVLFYNLPFFLPNKLSIEGVPPEEIECIYSPAKRRGPIPGRTSLPASSQLSNVRKASDMLTTNSEDGRVGENGAILGGQNIGHEEWMQLTGRTTGLMDPQVAAFLEAQQNKGNEFGNGLTNSIQQQISLIQQQLQQHNLQPHNETGTEERGARRVKVEDDGKGRGEQVPRTIMSHVHLLDRSDPEGSRLRAYYKLSIDELFCLPATPTDEEYCARLNVPGLTPSMIPGTHLAALSAARFAESALGAIVHNEVGLAMELCNAVVHCLRESIQESVETPAMYEVAKTYFLLGVFRAFRGDMARYFKYRRVCLTYLSKIKVRVFD